MRTILIVDDESSYRELLEFNLNEAGYRVLTASDGQQALEKAKADRPDLILLDGLLPKIHGFEVCSRIKKDPELSKTVIIIMTAVYKKIQYKYEAQEKYGADDYITKPFNLEDLLNRIKKHLPAGIDL